MSLLKTSDNELPVYVTAVFDMLTRYREILQLLFLLKRKTKKDVTMWNINELKHEGLVVFHHHTIICHVIRDYYKRVCD